jgi:hypothetical protein
MKRALFFFILMGVFLTGCGSPFAPIILAPTDTPVIVSPQELPDQLRNELEGRVVWWDDGLILLTSGKQMNWPPDDFENVNFSKCPLGSCYYVYIDDPVVIGDNGFPVARDETIGIFDFKTGQAKTLVSKAQSFPDAVMFGSATMTPDGQNVVFVVNWKNEADLVNLDLASKKMQRLHTDVLITGFGYPDVSKDGKIVVKCARVSGAELISELCLLDENGKFIRYLTAEGYPWPGNGRFTPDGQYVVYESRYKLYKVRVDGSNRQQIAPCSRLGPDVVTNDYAITTCFISQKPDCFGLFVAKLDGSDFRRIGYVEPYCYKDAR